MDMSTIKTEIFTSLLLAFVVMTTAAPRGEDKFITN